MTLWDAGLEAQKGNFRPAATEAAFTAVSIIAPPVVGKGIRVAIEKAPTVAQALKRIASSARSGLRQKWVPWENGTVGASLRKLPDGYNWVRNSEGDTGIRTPEGRVVTDTKAKEAIFERADLSPNSTQPSLGASFEETPPEQISGTKATEKGPSYEAAIRASYKKDSAMPDRRYDIIVG